MFITVYTKIIDAQLVKDLTNIENEVDEKVINPNIELAFRDQMEGDYLNEFWADLQQKINDVSITPLSPIYSELVQRLKLPLALFTEALCIEPSYIKHTAAGVLNRAPIDTNTPSFSSVSTLAANKMNRAYKIWQDVKDWIKKKGITKEFESKECDNYTPSGRTIGGIYFKT